MYVKYYSYICTEIKNLACIGKAFKIMTIFGIIVIILFAIGCWVLIFKLNDDADGFTETFFTTILTTILFLVIFELGSIDMKTEKSPVFGVTYISSLSSNSEISGHFCLGSGRVDEKNYYYYLSNTDKGYQFSKIEIEDNTYVKEDCNDKPFIEFTKYNCTYQNWFSKLFFSKSFFDENGEVVIHVPKGTVIKNYNVDVSKL